MFLELSVLTLNIWGIPFVSNDRTARIDAISNELNSGKYDIVSLQEVWSQVDCETLKEKTKAKLPYSYYFHSGVIGSGLLVLSKYPIKDALFHAWSVNGYFHRVQHADWFGGKGVGLCKIIVGDHIVHLYNAHLHAEYDNENDEYKTHRVIQAFDTAQFIRATRGNAALQILAGDLNTQPQDLSYKVLLYISKMADCCMGNEISTHECHRNSYTSKRKLRKNPKGIRIDHIFMRSANHLEFFKMEGKLPFPDRVPNEKFSFSDHEALLVKLKLRTRKTPLNETVSSIPSSQICAASNVQIPNDTPNESLPVILNGYDDTHTQQCAKVEILPMHNEDSVLCRISVLQESVTLCEAALQQLKMDRIVYYSFAIFLTLLTVVLAEYSVPSGFKTLYLLLKFFIFGMLLFCVFMGSIWNFMENNGVLSGKKAMEMMLGNDKKFKENHNK